VSRAAATNTVESRAVARFPDVPTGHGHYESFYLKAAHPEEPLAVWIRYTVHRRPGASATASLWFTLFGGRGGTPRASKATLPAADLGAPAGDYIRVGDARLSPGRAVGRAPSDRHDVGWDLEFEAGDLPLRHLPREWMYRAPVPRTKLESPHPGTHFTGRVELDGERIDVEGWPGMVGHNWGREHAERWIWLHGTGFQEREGGTWLDAALGRIRVGPAITPWIGNGMLSLDGVRHRLGGIERTRATVVRESPYRCEFVLPGRGLTVEGVAESPREQVVGWLYADPEGGEHHTVNSSLASMRLQIRRDGEPPVTLATASGAAYELGMRESDHGVAIQPFPDG
jgi:hypothetical protein